MSRDWTLFLDDMIDACSGVVEFTRGLQPEAFVADRRTWLATIRLVEVIGEAAKSIPEDVRASHPDVGWKALIGMRNVLAHAYFSVDDDILWDVVSAEVPALLDALEAIRAALD